jgi:hypothetical protein
VTQANGKVESVRHHRFRPNEVPVPGAGAVVFVPQEERGNDGMSYTAMAGATAQVLGALVAILAIARH